MKHLHLTHKRTRTYTIIKKNNNTTTTTTGAVKPTNTGGKEKKHVCSYY